MSKRTYLSNSEKRKKKLAVQKENISKLRELTSFFTLKETNRHTNSWTSSFQSSETASTFDIVEDKINHEKNRVNLILGPLGKQAKPLGHTE